MKIVRQGVYTRGAGNANKACSTDRRQRHFMETFNCKMIGTFNLRINTSVHNEEIGLPCRTGLDKTVIFNYWLVKLTTINKKTFYAYMLRWEGSSMRLDNLELVSKQKIPSEFKNDILTVEIYTRWDEPRIRSWVNSLETRDRFQGHLHDNMKRSDSTYVWGLFKKLGYSGKTVLDIGCNTGFYSFRAASLGAIVTAIDKNAHSLKIARTIQEQIEMSDVQFYNTEQFKWQGLKKEDYYDYIFYLSVHHQIDPKYKNLKDTLKYLKKHCSKLCLELIVPDLTNTKTEAEINEIITSIKGKKLSRYKHRVRKYRNVYLIS